MNDYLLSVLLGVIEGLTEFLPISSTAHLRIAEALLGLSLEDEFWKMFSVVIQLGAILAVVVYFWQRLLNFLRSFPTAFKTSGEGFWRHPVTLTAIAFVTTAIPAFLLTKLIGQNLESLSIIGTSLAVGGIAMWVVDASFTQPRILRIEEMRPGQAVWIGAVQILSAVFPGTSRSMSTIASGQIAGLSREAALEFSFFLSIPTMAAATGYDLLKTILHGEVSIGPRESALIAIGLVVSFAVALGVIAWFMSWVRRRGFAPFAMYRIVLGLGVIVWAVSRF